MAVTHHKSSRTIRGITYNYGDTFKCYASYGGTGNSEGGGGTASNLTAGTTYYYLGYAIDDDTGSLASYPYAVGTTSSGIHGWFKENVFPYATYTIKYNANGGSGAPSSQTKTHGTNLTLSSTKPTRSGYTFKGWALTQADANNGTWYYQAGGTCGKNENLTLYAVWEANTLTIRYNVNGGTLNSDTYYISSNLVYRISNSSAITTIGTYNNIISSSGLYNASTFGLTRTGYTFKGWKVGSSGTTVFDQDDATLVPTDLTNDIKNGSCTITLYAVWDKNTYTINYNGNGGNGSIKSQTVQWDDTFILSDNTFKREGYKFVGWNAYRNADNAWYVIDQGWLTEDVILENGYEKKIYGNQNELVFNLSWVRGNENVISQYTMYAVWEISGVVYIDNGTAFEPYLAYIDNGSEWELYLMYVDSGAKWQIIS